jgi:hypothetical protein
MDNKRKFHLIKLVHTLIWGIFVAVLFYILYSAITDTITIYTWIGIVLILVEGLVILIFKMSCPLTFVARKYSDSQKYNFDIFLPVWLAKYNKLIFASFFIVGLFIVLFRIISRS